MREQHRLEIQSQQKLIDDLRRSNSSLDNDIGKCKRDLQSSQQRCTALEKLLSGRETAHRDALHKLLHSATEAETRLEDAGLNAKELKSKITTTEGKLAALHMETKEKEARHDKVAKGLQRELHSMQEQNQTLSSRIPYLEDTTSQAQIICTKEKQKMQQVTEHKVRDASIECEALRVANENEKLKVRETGDLLEKQDLLNQATLEQLTREKKELTARMEKALSDERDVGKCLMIKVQELNTKSQKLTAENLRWNQRSNKHMDQIFTLENIIACGEVKLSQFGKQLARSVHDQTKRIAKEVELKKELSGVIIELEKLKRR